jgi:hypothetical protein
LLKKLAAASIAIAALAGCGQAAVAAAAPTSSGRPAGVTSAHEPSAVAKAAHPLLGVDVYSETDYTVGQAAAYGTTVLGYLHTGLNAQVAALMWDLCSPGFRSEVVHACAHNAKTDTGTLSSAAVAKLASIAKADKLQVAMRPIIRVGSPSGWNNAKVSWEGHINPPNQRKWFESLLKAEMPYLKVAKTAHVEQFVVGTELAGVQFSSSWKWFLGQAGKACGCQVSYAAQMTQYLKNRSRLPYVRGLGTDYYPALALPSNASQARVTKGWEAAVAKIGKSRLPRTSLDEVSILGVAGAYRQPANWNLRGAADPTVQARYFTAACQTAAHFHMHALFFYFVPLNDDPAHPQTFRAFFVHNAGSKAISGCRKILG